MQNKPNKNNGLNMGITLFNKLPEQLKKLETKHRFKNNVKKYLLQNVFYSVNEYLTYVFKLMLIFNHKIV